MSASLTNEFPRLNPADRPVALVWVIAWRVGSAAGAQLTDAKDNRGDTRIMNSISRRLFLSVSSAALAASAVGIRPALAAAATGEAPMLKALVDSGTLPPLADRLPKNPMVVTPLQRSGQVWRHLALDHRRRRFAVDAVPLSGL